MSNSKFVGNNNISFPSALPMTKLSEWRHNPFEEKEWSGPFTFIHGTDTQFGLIEKYILKKENPKWEAEKYLVNQMIDKINQLEPTPKFVVITGDMVDTAPFPDRLQEHKEQYVDFVACFKRLNPEIELICVPGNHDIGDKPTKETIDIYHQEYGPDFFSFWVGGVKFSVLNTQYYKISKENDHMDIKEHVETHNAFVDDLKNVGDKVPTHSVVFQHIPFFVKLVDEEDVSYLNIDGKIRRPVLASLKASGVKHIFCGHTHYNCGGFSDDLEQTVTSAVGGTFNGSSSGFRIVHVNKESITHEFVPLDPYQENSVAP